MEPSKQNLRMGGTGSERRKYEAGQVFIEKCDMVPPSDSWHSIEVIIEFGPEEEGLLIFEFAVFCSGQPADSVVDCEVNVYSAAELAERFADTKPGEEEVLNVLCSPPARLIREVIQFHIEIVRSYGEHNGGLWVTQQREYLPELESFLRRFDESQLNLTWLK
ncbi:MAG: hypothetical protein HY717_04320 [Planctomycetes bacterium]|nr:hypothetical protein [Planctomycetota bacterium]